METASYKDLGKESRKGLTDGLREFIRRDNECALEVGYFNQAEEHLSYEGRKFQKDARR